MSKGKKVEHKPNKRFEFSPDVLKMLDKYEKSQNPPNRFSNFQMPSFNGQSTIVKDSETHQNITKDSLPINNCDFTSFGKINKTLINNWFLGYQEYSLLSQNGIIQNIIQSYAQDSVREWIEIKSTSKDKTDKSDKIAALNEAFENFKVKDKFKNAMELTIMFGGCKIYPKIKGDDNTEGGATITTPFYKESMGKGDLLYLKVIEPLYATPIEFNSTNPLAEDFYVPSLWTVLTTPIHASRMCHFAYNYVPTLLKPVYWFYGMPLVQLCLDYIFGFESVRQNVVGVSGRYNLNIFKTNMEALLNNATGSTFQQGQDLETRLKIAQMFMSNFSVFALSNDKELPEEWQQFNMTIAGLDNLLNQNAELVCAVARIPAIKLFGTSPRGFNATGENELRIYYDLIRSMQMSVMQPNLQQIFELIQIHVFGQIDPDLHIHFKPLWTESSLETAQIQQIRKDINLAYEQAGILTVEEVRKKLNADPDSGYSDLPEEFEEDDEDELTDEESEEENPV